MQNNTIAPTGCVMSFHIDPRSKKINKNHGRGGGVVAVESPADHVHVPLKLSRAFACFSYEEVMEYVGPLTQEVQPKFFFGPGGKQPGHIAYAYDPFGTSAKSYRFSINKVQAADVNRLSTVGRDVRSRLIAMARDIAGEDYNTVLINRYVEGGPGTLGPHTDDEGDMKSTPILSISFTKFSTVRYLKWYYDIDRAKQKGKRHTSIETRHGDALLGDFYNHKHQVLKPSDDNETVCLTFRRAS